MTPHTDQGDATEDLIGVVDELTTHTNLPPSDLPNTTANSPDKAQDQTSHHDLKTNTQRQSTARKSTRIRNDVSYKGMCSTAVISDCEPRFDCVPEVFSVFPSTSVAPKSYRKAMSSEDAVSWAAACDKEMMSLKSKHVWTLVDRPTNRQVIRGLWLFKYKHLPDGSIKHKSRFVAMGNTQVEGVDCGETFAPTGKPASLRLLVAMAAIHGWDIHQMDAVTAFLNGLLHEDIYIEQPEGYKDQLNPNKVRKLNKSLYGLRQSPKIWQDDVKKFLLSIDFVQCEINHCTYIRATESTGKFTAIYLHVDDLAITGNDISYFKEQISEKW